MLVRVSGSTRLSTYPPVLSSPFLRISGLILLAYIFFPFSISLRFHPLRFLFDTLSRGWLVRLVSVDFWHRFPRHRPRSAVWRCFFFCAFWSSNRVCYWEALCVIETIPELSESGRRYLYCHIIADVDSHQLVAGMIAANKHESISREKSTH